MLWTHASVVVPPFTGTTVVDLPVPCSFDFNVAATKYFHALEDGEVPLCLLFSGTIFYSDDDGFLQVSQIPWEKEASFRLPVSVWKDMMELYYPTVRGSVLSERRVRSALPIQEPPGNPDLGAGDRVAPRFHAGEGRIMNQALVDQIASAVLYEGYILYPYRPSVKNRQRWTFGGLVPRGVQRGPGRDRAVGNADGMPRPGEPRDDGLRFGPFPAARGPSGRPVLRPR